MGQGEIINKPSIEKCGAIEKPRVLIKLACRGLICIFCFKKKILCARIPPDMKRFYVAILSIFVVMAFGPLDVFALDIFGKYTVEENQVIDDGINIESSATIVNHGTIKGTIHIAADGAIAVFENYGEISAEFDCGTGVILEQKITEPANVRPIANMPGHSISVVKAYYAVNMADLVNLSDTTTQIKLNKSTVVINGDLSQVTIPVIIDGNAVTMSVRGVSESWLSNSGPIIANIQGGTPFVQVVGIDSVYTLTPRFGADGALYLDLTRQTDYSEVLPNNDGLGEFLDNLRETNPESPLITRLDEATNMEEIVSIRNQSAQTNPVKLMKSIKTIHSLIMPHVSPNSNAFGIDVMPLYVYSDDFYYYGGIVNLAGKLSDNLVGKIGFGLGHLNFENALDTYSGTLYSGNFELGYFHPDFYLRAAGVVSYSDFHDINVFNHNKLVRGPNGMAESFVLDSGTSFRAFDVLDISPFVGARLNYVYLRGNQEIEFPLRAGTDIAHHTVIGQNDYTVGAHIFVQSDNVYYGEFYTNVVSDADAVAGGFSIGILYDDMGVSYKASANAKILF